MQDPKMYVRKFQEEIIEYIHDTDLLAKLFSHSLKDEARKWYFQLPKNSIDRHESLIHVFLHTFSYNIVEKVYFKDSYKTKQLPNQSIRDFIKVWKQTTNKIIIPEQDMKDAFSNGLLPIYKLFFIDNHDMSLDNMIDLILKKEPCITKIYAMKKHGYTSPPNIVLEHTPKAEENHVTHKWRASPTHKPPPKSSCQFNPLINIVDNILNKLLSLLN